MYDLIIIGSGWAGFNAALKAKGRGLKVALIEKGYLGGTCLNFGCIPTKALLESAKVYQLCQKATSFGINSPSPSFDFTKIQERKEAIIKQLRLNMESNLKGIDFFKGSARLILPKQIQIGNQNLKTKFILIACGAKPIELKFLKFDRQKILSSNEVLDLKEIPKSLLIIGAGAVGCEFAQLFSTLGAQVAIVEKMPQLLPGEDREVAKKLETVFKKKGIEVSLNCDAATLNTNAYEKVLVAVGRSPDLGDLGIENLSVDDYLKTNLADIYAAGDCTAKIMLAHFASYEGRLAVENMVSPDNPKKIETHNVPNCIFTQPEIASVGINEEKAKDQGRQIKIHKFDFLGSGMARILDETQGFIKIISDANTDTVIGASIIGPKATELINLLCLAQTAALRIRQLKELIFAHPTISEAIAEALK